MPAEKGFSHAPYTDYALEATLTAIKGVDWGTGTLQAIYDMLIHGGYGLEALDDSLVILQARLTAARAGHLDHLDPLHAGDDRILNVADFGNTADDTDALLARPAKYAWKKQPIANVNITTVVEDTWYTILDTTEDVKLLFIALRQINDEAAAKSCSIKLTIDGVTMTGNISHTNNIAFHWRISPYADVLTAATTLRHVGLYVFICGQSVKVEMRLHATVGTNQSIRGWVQHETFEET